MQIERDKNELLYSYGPSGCHFEKQVGTRGRDNAMNVGSAGVTVNFRVLPGAVAADVNISISTDDEQLSGDVFLTFGPHGTNFQSTCDNRYHSLRC